MIFTIKQLRSQKNMTWIIEEKEETLCIAIAPFEKGSLNIMLEYPEHKQQRLYFNPSDTNYGTSIEEKMSFKLFEKDTLLATLVGKNQKVKGLFQSYAYRVMNYQGKNYYLYEVGFGNKGLYLCIYEEDTLIAIVDKDLVTKNYQDTYTVYSNKKENTSFIIPLVLHYDMGAFSNMMELSVASIKKQVVNTKQKALIEKYDPDFISNIKAMDK